VHHFGKKTSCGKNAQAAENVHIFQLVSVFQLSVTHPRELRVQHAKLSQPRPESAECVFAIAAF
jgi:hypothetical protein